MLNDHKLNIQHSTFNIQHSTFPFYVTAAYAASNSSTRAAGPSNDTTTNVWSSSGGRLRVNLRIDPSNIFLIPSADKCPASSSTRSNRSNPNGSPSSSIASINPSL